MTTTSKNSASTIEQAREAELEAARLEAGRPSYMPGIIVGAFLTLSLVVGSTLAVGQTNITSASRARAAEIAERTHALTVSAERAVIARREGVERAPREADERAARVAPESSNVEHHAVATPRPRTHDSVASPSAHRNSAALCPGPLCPSSRTVLGGR